MHGFTQFLIGMVLMLMFMPGQAIRVLWRMVTALFKKPER